DEWALHLMMNAGYNAGASVGYLKVLESRHLAERRALAAFLDVHPARSRRRCLAETLLSIHRDHPITRKSNRDAYRRAAAALSREDHPVQPGRRPGTEPCTER